MSDHIDIIRQWLQKSPMTARQLIEYTGVSQPTCSRALNKLAQDVVRIGAASSTKYALRNYSSEMSDVPVFRVDSSGKVCLLGQLLAVYPHGYVMAQNDGQATLHDGMPWWMVDMRPQGYLGRAYAARYASALGLSANLNEWTDSQVFQALLAHGQDVVGNLLLGELAKQQFLSAQSPQPITRKARQKAYVRLAEQASNGDIPGSSAGGEQPKFMAYVSTKNGAQHVLVKFTAVDNHPVTQRWRDLLLAEHWALQTLRQHHFPAPVSEILDIGTQRFLQVERFDRVGELGRLALISLQALDAEFVGQGSGGWCQIAQQLAKQKVITHQASQQIALLYAFGRLIGNTDMHLANVSLQSEQGRPYAMAPAYDMLPMMFAPRAGGSLSYRMPTRQLDADIPHPIWKDALAIALDYVINLKAEKGFSEDFQPCLQDLYAFVNEAERQIGRMG